MTINGFSLILSIILGYFLLWTFLLYWVHRCAHKFKFLKKFHNAHHLYIKSNSTKWSWTNLFFYMDNRKSSFDVVLIEVIPTLVFCLIFDTWWIFIFYWIWAASLQEIIEHKSNLNIPIFTSGKWHMIHHYTPNKNYGLFIPLWDFIFGTYSPVVKKVSKT